MVHVPTTRYYVSYVYDNMTRFVSSEHGHNTKDKTKVHYFNKRIEARKAIDVISDTCRYTIHKQRASYVHEGRAIYPNE